MKQSEYTELFGLLGEILRDITAIEFLMRCAIAKKDWEILNFPKPPYSKDTIYTNYPDSFWHYSFEIIVEKFHKRLPEIKIPQELIGLRDAIAHWIISEIWINETPQLVKFKESKINPKELKVEFSINLDQVTLKKLRQLLNELRRAIILVAGD
jgi:hypothetical protein